MPHPAPYVIFTILCIPVVAVADPPAAPVALEVTAADSPGRVRFALRNVTGAPVEVVADRRLLSFTATPPPVEPGARRRQPAASGDGSRTVGPASSVIGPEDGA